MTTTQSQALDAAKAAILALFDDRASFAPMIGKSEAEQKDFTAEVFARTVLDLTDDRIAALSAEVERLRHSNEMLQADFNDCNAERARWEKHATTGDQVLGRTRTKLTTAEAQVAALTKQLNEAAEVIEPFIPEYAAWMDDWSDETPTSFYRPFTFGHLRAALSWQATTGRASDGYR